MPGSVRARAVPDEDCGGILPPQGRGFSVTAHRTGPPTASTAPGRVARSPPGLALAIGGPAPFQLLGWGGRGPGPAFRARGAARIARTPGPSRLALHRGAG